MRKGLEKVKRIVVKIGTSSITHENGMVNLGKIRDLSWQLANLKNYGYEVVLVSSGAVSAGAGVLNFKSWPYDLDERQAASAAGQVALMHAYNSSLSEFNYRAAQLLLTKEIETNETMNKNAKASFEQLLKLNCIPIINENDAISTFELAYDEDKSTSFGDNDTLSAVVARLIDADLLIILSDVDGMFDKDPNLSDDAKLIEDVYEITDEYRRGATGVTSNRGTGGMATKLNAADLCMEKGISMLLANGKDMNIIREIFSTDDKIGTLFHGGKNC